MQNEIHANTTLLKCKIEENAKRKSVDYQQNKAEQNQRKKKKHRQQVPNLPIPNDTVIQMKEYIYMYQTREQQQTNSNNITKYTTYSFVFFSTIFRCCLQNIYLGQISKCLINIFYTI